jgi:glutamine amidotransferase
MIAVVDSGMGNLGSILNMLKKIGVEARLCADAADVGRAEKLILPGIGAFDVGMRSLASRRLIEPLNERVLLARVPVLGICLGMQLLAATSEEGQLPGLGWLRAETRRFRFDGGEPLRVPHMGWNTVNVAASHALFEGLDEEPRFYFVHSYHLACHDSKDVVGVTHYGYDFPAVVARGNIMGTQFHPEKSHRFGMQLLKNFSTRV